MFGKVTKKKATVVTRTLVSCGFEDYSASVFAIISAKVKIENGDCIGV